MSIFSPHSRSSSRPFDPAQGRGLARRPRTAEGFTLIELLVVVAIITIMTAVLLLQQKKFDSSTLLRSLGYSIALSVRQAQVYGTSVREFGSANFNYNYGVYFFSGTGGTDTYYLFADAPPYDHQWASGETVQQFKLGSGYTIVKFCGITSGGSQTCTPNISWLSIYFKRPNPDSFFAASSGGPFTSAYMQLSGPGGDTRTVVVTSTGQILVCGVNAVYPTSC